MEPRDPVKEKNGSGTGMGTLIPTCPTLTSCWYFLAAAPDWVKMAQPLPYLELLVNSMAYGEVDRWMDGWVTYCSYELLLLQLLSRWRQIVT